MLDLDASKGKRRHMFRRLLRCCSATVFDEAPIIESRADREARQNLTKHNELALITRLPRELLAAIFVLCVPVSPRTIEEDLTWLNVARVSSQWRSVALGCPDLWSTLILSRPNSIPVFLARSKMASLIVRVDLGRLWCPPAPILLDHASRLGTLDLRSSQSHLTELMSDLENAGAAPRLRNLKIVITHRSRRELGMWLPRDLFRRTAVLNSRRAAPSSASVSLHLDACAFPWDSVWYSHLTQLHLSHIDPAQCPTMETLLGILLASPALETLAILGCSPATSSASRHGFAVDLPLLTSLTLECNSSYNCARLLGYLTTPQLAALDVLCRIENESELDDALFNILIPRFSDVSHKCDAVRITHGINGVSILLVDSVHPERTRQLTIDYPAIGPVYLTQILLAEIDLSSISTLHLHDFPAWDLGSSNLWDMMGRNMRDVRTVHLHRVLPTTLLEFLLSQAMLLLNISDIRSCFSRYGPAMFRGPGGVITHAWPALTCLSLHGVNLGQASDLRQQQDSVDSPVPHGFNLGRASESSLADSPNLVPFWVNLSKAPERPQWDPDMLRALPPQPTPAAVLRALLWARRAGHARIWQLQIEDCRNVCSADLAHFRLFAEVTYDGRGASTMPKFEQDEKELEEYSLDVFADLMEYLALKSRIAYQF